MSISRLGARAQPRGYRTAPSGRGPGDDAEGRSAHPRAVDQLHRAVGGDREAGDDQRHPGGGGGEPPHAGAASPQTRNECRVGEGRQGQQEQQLACIRGGGGGHGVGGKRKGGFRVLPVTSAGPAFDALSRSRLERRSGPCAIRLTADDPASAKAIAGLWRFDGQRDMVTKSPADGGGRCAPGLALCLYGAALVAASRRGRHAGRIWPQVTEGDA